MRNEGRLSGSFQPVKAKPRTSRARILLKTDEGVTDTKICEHLGCSIGTPYNARKNYCKRGLAAIHRRKPDWEYDPKLDSDAETRLLKPACSEPPEGHSRWTLHLLADELVILDETVRQRLKKRPETASL